jgi:tungstate transport system permease protein
MDFLWEGAKEAVALLVSGDADTWHGIWLSTWTSVVAVGLATLIGTPLGAWLALFRPFGREAWVFAFRVGTAVPTVAIGLFLYGLFSRRGPLGGLELLYEPVAIVIGQALLAIPILATFSHAACAGLDARMAETVRTHGGGRLAILRLGLSQTRHTFVAALLLAFGRCVTELGIALIVGGAIRFKTRTLPALVTLEASRGELGRATAACLILVLLACGAVVIAHLVSREERR